MNILHTNFLRIFCLTVFMVLAVGLSACNKKENLAAVMSAQPSEVEPAMPAMAKEGFARSKMMGQAKMADNVAGGGEQSLTEVSEPFATNAAAQRLIAMRHSLVIETPAQKMQAAFDATVAHCEQLKCQILSANYTRETPYNSPSANLFIRIPPRSINIFLTGLAKSGDVLQHQRESEDKTDVVIDTEARIKNLAELRDKLRLMLTDKSAKFKDVIEVMRELSSTQEQLDSINGVRKALTQEIEMVAVNIEFRAAQGVTEQGFFAPVARAIDDAGRVLMESVATIITLVMGALPWLLLGIPTIVLVRKFWAKIKVKFL